MKIWNSVYVWLLHVHKVNIPITTHDKHLNIEKQTNTDNLDAKEMTDHAKS